MDLPPLNVRTSSLAIHRQLVLAFDAGAVLPRYSGSDLLDSNVLKRPGADARVFDSAKK